MAVTLSRRPLEDTGCQVLAYGAKDTGEMGGGAAQALLMLGGPELQEALRQELARTARGIGEVVFTEPFRMADRKALAICHIVSIRKHTSQGAWCPEPDKLAAGVERCLQGCRERNLSSVALSCLGTGEGRVDPAHAARMMVGAAKQHGKGLEVTFALPNARDYAAFERQLSFSAGR